MSKVPLILPIKITGSRTSVKEYSPGSCLCQVSDDLDYPYFLPINWRVSQHSESKGHITVSLDQNKVHTAVLCNNTAKCFPINWRFSHKVENCQRWKILTRGWFVSQRTTKCVFSFQLSFFEAPYIQPDFSLLTLNERDGPLHVIGCFAYNKGVSRWENRKYRCQSRFSSNVLSIG